MSSGNRCGELMDARNEAGSGPLEMGLVKAWRVVDGDSNLLTCVKEGGNTEAQQKGD